MSKSLRKISFISIILLMPLFQACTESGGFSSSRPSSKTSGTPNSINDILNPVKEVRGPTGGGVGGGIRIADNKGKLLKNKKVEIYIKSYGIKEKIKEAYTNSNGEIELDAKTFEKLKEDESSLIVEFYDGNDKSLANAELIKKSDS